MKLINYLKALHFLTLSTLFLTNNSAAEIIPTPNVDFSGIRQLVTSEGSFTQTVHYSNGKERNEMQMEGMSMVTILRPDKNIAWQIIPMQNMYMEVDLKSANKVSGNAPQDVTIEKVGNETLEGINATKYKILMKDKSAGGFIWLSPENIQIKMDFLSKQGKDKNRTTMTLKNLKIEPQEAALFDLPSDYQPMPNMGNIMKNFHPH